MEGAVQPKLRLLVGPHGLLIRLVQSLHSDLFCRGHASAVFRCLAAHSPSAFSEDSACSAGRSSPQTARPPQEWVSKSVSNSTKLEVVNRVVRASFAHDSGKQYQGVAAQGRAYAGATRAVARRILTARGQSPADTVRTWHEHRTTHPRL